MTSFKTTRISSWLLILLACCHMSSTHLECGQCTGGSTLLCPTHNPEDKKYEVKVYTTDAEDDSMEINCDYEVPVDFGLLEGCNFSSVSLIKFHTCSFDNESMSKVLDRIGVKTEKIIMLRLLYTMFNDFTLRFRHLKGLSNLTFLDLQYFGFESVDENAFDATPNLERLYLNGNNLTLLKPNTFQFLSNLRFLNLNYNNLTSLPPKLFDSLSKLTELYMLNNQLRTLPSHIFDSLPSLSNISFLKNEIDSVDNDLFIMNSNLFSVSFKLNNLKNLPQGLFRNCSKLNKVIFNNNRIENVSSLLFSNLSLLSELDLSKNNLKFLPQGLFRDCSKLNKVILNNNKIENVASLLFSNLSLLSELDLSKNNLKSLPSNLFQNNINLQKIDLRTNFLTTLPVDVFKSTPNVTELFLTNNSLVSLPDNLFSRCRSLSNLHLDENNLSSLSFNTFPSFPNSLVHIDLSHNNLNNSGIINNTVFALNHQLNLEFLDLSYNAFSEFPYNALLYNFLKLKKLSLNNNFITKIDGRDILNLNNDIEIDLSDNKIEQFSIPSRFEPRRIKIYLKGNKFLCDCKLYELVNHIQNNTPKLMVNNIQHNTPELNRLQYSTDNLSTTTADIHVTDQEKLVCHTPNSLFNQTLIYLNLSLLTCELGETKCSPDCPCLFRPLDRMVVVNCSNKRMSRVPNVVFDPRYNYTLNLSGNAISSFNFSNTPFVVVDLSDNNLNFGDLLDSTILPANLTFLDIRRNNLTSLKHRFLKQLIQTGAEIDARENPWLCDCALRDFQNFIQVHYEQMRFLDSVTCDGGDSNMPLSKLTKDKLCPSHLRTEVPVIIGALGALLVIFAVLGTVLYYRYKTAIKVWLFSHQLCLWLVTEDELDVDKQYDAFISYSHKDEEFVNKVMVPGLENGEPKYRVCLHYRDWVVGEFIQNQIMNSVHSSRRTLVVLSTNFIESVWGQMEFRVAHQQALQDKTNRVIVIVYGEMPAPESLDPELRHYVSLHTYLKWGDPRFWESLRYAMPHPRHLLSKRKKKNNNNKKIDRLELVNGNHLAPKDTSAIKV